LSREADKTGSDAHWIRDVARNLRKRRFSGRFGLIYRNGKIVAHHKIEVEGERVQGGVALPNKTARSRSQAKVK